MSVGSFSTDCNKCRYIVEVYSDLGRAGRFMLLKTDRKNFGFVQFSAQNSSVRHSIMTWFMKRNISQIISILRQHQE